MSKTKTKAKPKRQSKSTATKAKSQRISKHKAIFQAFRALQEALMLDDPDIVIQLHGYYQSGQGTGSMWELTQALKTFREAYAKYFGRQPTVELML